MLTTEQLRSILSRVEGATEIIVEPEGREVWNLLLTHLDDNDRARVSFVFTNTPEENAQAEQDAAASGA